MDRTIWVNCSSCYDSCSQAVGGSYANQLYDQMFSNKPDQHWSCWIVDNPTLNSARLRFPLVNLRVETRDSDQSRAWQSHLRGDTHRVPREQVRKYFDKVAPSVVDHRSGCLNVRQPGCTRRLTLELVRHHPVGRLRKDQRAWNITRSNWNSEIQFIILCPNYQNIL